MCLAYVATSRRLRGGTGNSWRTDSTDKRAAAIVHSTEGRNLSKKVVDARADKKGNISHVLLSGNATFTPVERAVRMADQGRIHNAHAVHPKSGPAYLRTNPDGRERNNLDHMAGDR